MPSAAFSMRLCVVDSSWHSDKAATKAMHQWAQQYSTSCSFLVRTPNFHLIWVHKVCMHWQLTSAFVSRGSWQQRPSLGVGNPRPLAVSALSLSPPQWLYSRKVDSKLVSKALQRSQSTKTVSKLVSQSASKPANLSVSNWILTSCQPHRVTSSWTIKTTPVTL